MLPLLAHINGVGAKLFSPKPLRKMTRYGMVNKQLFFTQKLSPTRSFPSNMAEVEHINLKLPGNYTKVPILESCNLNDSTKDGWLTTARALSSPHPSVFDQVFKSGAITIELGEINS